MIKCNDENKYKSSITFNSKPISVIIKMSRSNKKSENILHLLIPLKLFYYYIYQIIYRFIKLTIYEIMWKRAYGLILSVLIFTNIIEILQMELGGRKNLIIFNDNAIKLRV